jgi:hypothetical protein
MLPGDAESTLSLFGPAPPEAVDSHPDRSHRPLQSEDECSSAMIA